MASEISEPAPPQAHSGIPESLLCAAGILFPALLFVVLPVVVCGAYTVTAMGCGGIAPVCPCARAGALLYGAAGIVLMAAALCAAGLCLRLPAGRKTKRPLVVLFCSIALCVCFLRSLGACYQPSPAAESLCAERL